MIFADAYRLISESYKDYSRVNLAYLMHTVYALWKYISHQLTFVALYAILNYKSYSVVWMQKMFLNRNI